MIRYLLLLVVLTASVCAAQDIDNVDDVSIINRKGFHVGLYVGAYFPNNYTASIYDGYGIGRDGRRNDFSNSFLNRKINYEYGGGNGFPDQIAPQLGVNSGDWSFTEGDMPLSMTYNTAVLVGLHLKYNVNWNNAVIANINAAKLTAAGEFTITLLTPQNKPQSPGYINYKNFGIKGGEQRLFIQAGFQHIFGDSASLGFLVEGGPSFSIVKYDGNQIQINQLVIDITRYYDQLGYQTFQVNPITGFGVGAFAGLGLCFTGPKVSVQLLYIPSYDYINMGEGVKYTLQQALGLRAYYRIGK